MLPDPPVAIELHGIVAEMPPGNAESSTPRGPLNAAPTEADAAAAKPALASLASPLASVCVLANVAVGVVVGDGTGPATVGAGAGDTGVGVAAAGAGVVAAGAGAAVVELLPPPPQAAKPAAAAAVKRSLREVFIKSIPIWLGDG